VDAQAGLDPCWSQTHYVAFVVMRLIYKPVIQGLLGYEEIFSAQKQISSIGMVRNGQRIYTEQRHR
jgi:hypothetical protein